MSGHPRAVQSMHKINATLKLELTAHVLFTHEVPHLKFQAVKPEVQVVINLEILFKPVRSEMK